MSRGGGRRWWEEEFGLVFGGEEEFVLSWRIIVRV